MKIVGFQKMSLLNYPDHVSATIFTAGCNMRCPFCHNAKIALDKYEEYDENEILDYLNERKKILDGVCISGGEPLLQSDIKDFIKKVRALGLKVKLDTNGSFPGKLKELVNEGLVDYVAMDVKNSFEKYEQTAGGHCFELSKIKESIDFLMNCGVEYEFRTTVVKELHTEEDIEKIAQYLKGAKKYYLQNYEDNDDIMAGHVFHAYNANELKKFLVDVKPEFELAETRGI